MSLLKREWAHEPTLTVMSFNVLAESLANTFPNVNPEHLTPEYRTPRILAEIESLCPDVVCLQEVERFEVFNQALGRLGYEPGLFRMKRDSGDGCALFYKSSFELRTSHMFTYANSSQPCIIARIVRAGRVGRSLVVCNTHLKAKRGNESIREAQVHELLAKLAVRREPGDDVIIAGDWNDVPGSGAHTLVLEQGYYDADFYPYTTCKERGSLQVNSETTTRETQVIRETRVSDYIFYSSSLTPIAHVSAPLPAQPLPSAEYPSDHLAVVVKFVNLPPQQNEINLIFD